MEVKINKDGMRGGIDKELKVFSNKVTDDRKARLSKFFGVLNLKEDALTFQRRWRDGN